MRPPTLEMLMMRPDVALHHPRQERARDVHQPEHVGLVLAPHLGLADLRGRSEDAEAGVVDEHVGTATAGQPVDLDDRRRDRGR